MATRRIAASSIDWAAFAARVPEGQKAMFNAFKGKSDAHLRSVLSQPESLPKIDFSAYKTRIAMPGMVDEFQKKYEAMEIPYPADTVSGQIDEVEKTAAIETKEFIKASEARIVKLKEELVRWEQMIPYDQMTMEELVVQFPEESINIENPSLWPHTPDMVPGYVAKEGVEE